jgi:hypothetical protein
MERVPPPSGADRLSENASRSNQPDERFRLVQGELASEAALNEKSELLDLYRVTYGFPDEIFDLSVDELTERRLTRSPWACVVRIALNPGQTRHPGIRDIVIGRLLGRDPNVTLDDRFLSADFLIEDGSHKSQMRAADFAFTAALLVDGVPERVSVSLYKGLELGSQQPTEPPSN